MYTSIYSEIRDNAKDTPDNKIYIYKITIKVKNDIVKRSEGKEKFSV